jgi:hypothetical protein
LPVPAVELFVLAPLSVPLLPAWANADPADAAKSAAATTAKPMCCFMELLLGDGCPAGRRSRLQGQEGCLPARDGGAAIPGHNPLS